MCLGNRTSEDWDEGDFWRGVKCRLEGGDRGYGVWEWKSALYVMLCAVYSMDATHHHYLKILGDLLIC